MFPSWTTFENKALFFFLAHIGPGTRKISFFSHDYGLQPIHGTCRVWKPEKLHRRIDRFLKRSHRSYCTLWTRRRGHTFNRGREHRFMPLCSSSVLTRSKKAEIRGVLLQGFTVAQLPHYRGYRKSLQTCPRNRPCLRLQKSRVCIRWIQHSCTP